ncbi:MAG: hypothetical protein ACXAB4_12300 [Candidatus Hodarchaeales archaeon]|jgi:hypothetical protein
MRANIHLFAISPQHWLVVTELELIATSTTKNLLVKLSINSNDLRTIPKQNERISIQPSEMERIMLCWKIVQLSDQKTTITVSFHSEEGGEKTVSTVLPPTAMS